MFIFRFPPVVYFILAPLLLAFGIFLYFSMAADDAARTKALGRAAPPEVAIEAYDRTRHRGAVEEAVVVAQLDIDSMVEVVKSKRGVERSRTLVGRLYPATATDARAPAAGVLVTQDGLTPAQIEAMMIAKGSFGPILRIDGQENRVNNNEAEKALEGGPPLAPGAIFMHPFANGRVLGLAPHHNGPPMLFLGAVSAVLTGAYGLFRRRTVRKQAERATVAG